MKYKPVDKDHYLIGDNPFGKEDTWLIDREKFYSKWTKREQTKLKFDTAIANKKDINKIKNTNYKK